ncbi:tetratricopeptide repeat protein, partial [Candidatus Poribacteria bacterium]|nr:tetratricopeptide repeat protein [Candidatus Poribacteria bacterium]
GDYNGAIADYDRYIELNSGDAEAYYRRGQAKKALGQHDAAQADFQKAKALDPNVGE